MNDTEEYASGDVHLITDKTIARYKKLIKEPLLRNVLMKEMWVEQDVVVQKARIP